MKGLNPRVTKSEAHAARRVDVYSVLGFGQGVIVRCIACGLPTTYNPETRRTLCPYCGEESHALDYMLHRGLPLGRAVHALLRWNAAQKKVNSSHGKFSANGGTNEHPERTSHRSS